MKKILLILLASMSLSFGQLQTNKVNNTATIYSSNSTVKLNSSLNMGGFKITNMLAGTAPLDAVNFSQLTNSLASSGNVYTYSNNFFNPNLTNTFNGPVVMTGTNFPGVTNFINNSPAGSIVSYKAGTNLYINSGLAVTHQLNPPASSTDFPQIDGLTILNDTNFGNALNLGKILWHSDAITAGSGQGAYIQAIMFGTNTIGRIGTELRFAVRTDGQVPGVAQRYAMNPATFYGSSGTSVSNFFAYLTGANMTGVINAGGFNMTNLLAGVNPLDAVNYTQLTSATNAVNLLPLNNVWTGNTNDFRNFVYFSTNVATQRSMMTPDGTLVIGTNNWDNSMVYGNYGVYLNGRDLLIEAEDLTGGFVLKPLNNSFSFYTEGGAIFPSAIINQHTPQIGFSTNFPYGTVGGLTGNGGMSFFQHNRRLVIFAPNSGGGGLFSIPMIQLTTNNTMAFGSTNALGGGTITNAPVQMLGWWSTNVTVDFASILAASFEDQIIPFQGTKTNDVVTLGFPALQNSALNVISLIPSNHYLLIRAQNVGTLAADQAPMVYRFIINRYP